MDMVVHSESGRLAADTPADKVRAMVGQAARHGKIAIHFHGGLVSYRNGMDIANRLADVYWNKGAGSYPLFFVWESGLLETLQNNLGEIAWEDFFKLLWKKIAAIVERKMAQGAGDRAAGTLPSLDTRSLEASIDQALVPSAAGDGVQKLAAGEPGALGGLSELTSGEQTILRAELEGDAALVLATARVTSGLRVPSVVQAERDRGATFIQGSTVARMDASALEELVDRPAPGARGILSVAKVAAAVVKIAARVISRRVRNRDHGLHATIIEELLRAFYMGSVGKLIWDAIKKDAADAFAQPGETYCGTCVLEALRDNIPVGARPRITLVGHSTGAIYIAKFLESAQSLVPGQKFDVVFLAPASRFDLTAGMLREHGARINQFRLFAMTDANEKADRLVPVLYPHSLLYFVSGVVEGDEDVPIVGMQRFYDPAHFPAVEFPDVETVRSFVSQSPQRAVWSVSSANAPGLNTASLKHGDFDNDPETLASLTQIALAGLGGMASATVTGHN